MRSENGIDDTSVIVVNEDNMDETVKKLAILREEVARLEDEYRTKKAELKKLTRAVSKAEKALARKKAKEDRARLLEAVANSSRTLEEILEFLKNE